MQTLKEFLATADADHAVALQQARDYVAYEPQFISSNTLTVYVVQASLYAFLSDKANDAGSPMRSICMALMDRLRGVSEFNLSAQLPLGQANRAMLQALIDGFADSHPEESAKLTALKGQLEVISDKEVQPFANATLHDVLIIRDDCPKKPLQPTGRQVVIELQGEFEPHKPRLMAQDEAGNWRRINNFCGADNGPCSTPGKYACVIPREFAGWPLAVDDAYGAVV